MNKLLLTAMLSTSIYASDIADLKLPDFYAPEILKLNDEFASEQELSNSFALRLFRTAASELLEKHSINLDYIENNPKFKKYPKAAISLYEHIATGKTSPEEFKAYEYEEESDAIGLDVVLKLYETDAAKAFKDEAIEVYSRFSKVYKDSESKVAALFGRLCDEVLPKTIKKSEVETYNNLLRKLDGDLVKSLDRVFSLYYSFTCGGVTYTKLDKRAIDD